MYLKESVSLVIIKIKSIQLPLFKNSAFKHYFHVEPHLGNMNFKIIFTHYMGVFDQNDRNKNMKENLNNIKLTFRVKNSFFS